MSHTIESLWPHQIRQGVLSPTAILKAQAEALTRQTGGILLGEINREVTEGRVSLAFNIVVPALDNYRHRVLDVFYGEDFPYPAVVDAEVLRPGSSTLVRALVELGSLPPSSARADSDQELIALVEKVLNSPRIVSAAQSLLARASDVLNEDSSQTDRTSASVEEPPRVP